MRNKTKIICFLFCIAQATYFTQIKSIDKVLKRISSLKDDTSKCNELTTVIEQETDATIWIKYNEELERIAKNGTAQKNSPLKLQQKYLFFLAGAINNKGFYWEEKGEMDSALSFYRQSLEMRYDIKDKDGISNSFNNIGYVYFRRSDYKQALLYYRKAIEIQKTQNDERGLATSLCNMGSIFLNQKRVDSANVYFKSAFKIRERNKDSLGLASLFMNFAAAFYVTNKKDSALSFILKAANIREKLNDKSGLANCYNSIGKHYADANQVDLAVEYTNKAIDYYLQTKSTVSLPLPLYNLGCLYLKMGNQPMAKTTFEKSFGLGKEIGYPILIAKPARELYKIYKKENNLTKALNFLEICLTMEDSISKANNIVKVSSEDSEAVKYKSELLSDSLTHHQQLDTLKSEIVNLKGSINTQRKIALALLVLVLFLASTSFYFFRRSRIKK